MKLIAKKEFQTIRIKKGLSLSELSHQMEVNVSVVSKMERGQPVRPATARKTCMALDETFETLFTIEDEGGLNNEPGNQKTII